jgi:hypothetical protein
MQDAKGLTDMSSDLELLMVLSRLDDEIFLKEKDAGRKPLKLAEDEAHLKSLEKESELLAEDIKRVQKDAHLTELDVKAVESEMLNYQVKLNTARTNEEYRLLNDKIKELRASKGELEERALEFLTEADTLKSQLEQHKRRVADEQTRFVGLKKDVDSQVAHLREEIAVLQGKRAEIQSQIAAEQLLKYERAKGRLGYNVVVEVRDDICMGCHMSVAPNVTNMIMGGKIMTCAHCNRIFYLPKE